MTYLIVIGVGVAFGALDQYLGTVHVTSHLGTWTITVSQMSAPWLVLPFAVGMTQERSRRAMALGLLVTMGGLLGYFVMSNSPAEGVPVHNAWPRIVAMVSADWNRLWIAGGVVTGLAYGYFGHRWRVARSWIGAALVTGGLCFESLARATVGRPLFGDLSGPTIVWGVEVALGLFAAIWFVWLLVRARQANALLGEEEE